MEQTRLRNAGMDTILFMRAKNSHKKFSLLWNRPVLICLTIILLSCQLLQAQKLVTGVVVDDQKVPLPGVTIQVAGQTKGALSDLDGNYSISVEPSDTLVFSMIGMASQRFLVGEKLVIDVQLLPEVNMLDEVVVIGYGVVKKRDLTGSVSSLKSKDITKITSFSPEQSLQGKVAGVQVVSVSGAPGQTPMVRIRGVGTFNNSDPIFVVDGVILSDISFLNSADIESMEVLKDASATAIYGSRGANGVIMVTTKRGKIGEEKATVSYSGEYGIQKLAKKIDLLNGREFAIISNEIRAGSYNNVDLVPNTDWQELVFHTAPIQSHQLSFSGSTKRVQYYVGFGYTQQDGIIDKSGYKRFTIKLNNTYQIFENIKIGNNITIAPYKQQNAPNVTYAVYRAQPLLVPYYSDGSYGVVYNVGNPLASLAYSNDYRKGLRGVGDIFGEAKILKLFILKSDFGIDAAYNKAVSFTPAYTVYNPDGSASQQQNVTNDLYKGYDDNLTWIWENTLTYIKEFDKHSINAVAGFTMQNSASEKTDVTGENIIRDSEDFWYITGSSLASTYNSYTNEVLPDLNYSMVSFLFRVNYTYNKKYIFTATYRRDGSSKFKENNRFGDFPSFAAGWNISEEKFMQNFPLISNLKLRGSWGKIGNEKIDYYKRYAKTQDYLAVFGQNETANAAVSYGTAGNPNLKWETTTQSDLGLEIGFFKGRLTTEFDYYHKETNDILVDLTTPGHLGNGLNQKITFNAGSVLNSGLELQLTWKDNIGELNYSIGVQGSTIHNEVLMVGGNSGVDSLLKGGYLANGLPVTESRVGLPIGSFYGYKTNGIFQNQAELDAYPHLSDAGVGDLRFVDVNNDNVLDGKDRTEIGSPIPKFIFGFNIELQYKGFDVSVDLQGQTGNKIFNGKEVVRPDPYNFEKHVFDRWTGEGTSNTEPKPSFGGYNYIPNDHFIQDGSFMRLRNLSIGYTLPESISKRLNLQQLRVYIKGTNLYTLTKFTGYTPEIGSKDVLSNNIDDGIYPVTAVYSIGLNLTL
jgi:TonB-linked SusC/RagA family outer membrane protein